MKEVELTPKAHEDLESIWLYGFNRFGINQADRYIQQFSEHFTLLAGQNVGRRRRELGEDIYALPCARHVIFYLVSSACITVIRVLHHSQDVVTHLHWQ